MGGPPPIRRIRRLLAAVALLLAGSGYPAAAQDGAFVQAVKAAYLYKFAAFVEWPPGVFAAPASPFTICVVGDYDFSQIVARAVAGQQLGRRDFVVRFFTAIGRDAGCHTLYAGGDSRSAFAALEAVRGLPVLTVTDAASGGWPRGVVHFVLHRGRVRFEIDARLAREQGLGISSRVLELALDVRR